MGRFTKFQCQTFKSVFFGNFGSQRKSQADMVAAKGMGIVRRHFRAIQNPAYHARKGFKSLII